MVELRGKKSESGIDVILGPESAPTDLRKLLQRYSPTERSADELWQQRFDREALQGALRAMAQAGLMAAVARAVKRTFLVWP